jgi:arylsulfatase A-like enzyme
MSYQNVSVLQTAINPSIASGIDSAAYQSYAALANISNVIQVSDETQNAFICTTFQFTHQPTLLNAPEYVPSQNVNNTDYDIAHSNRFIINGQELIIETAEQMAHYHVNMAAFIQLGRWFDTLRDYGIYDNTRIIVAADHGHNQGHIQQLILGDGSDQLRRLEQYFPLLLFKDFNSTEFTISKDFMTNADVPTLATQNLISAPINPFTGKEITNNEKYAHDQFIIASNNWDINTNNGNVYLPERWASVHDDLWNPENWTFYDEEIVLTEHELPEQ